MQNLPILSSINLSSPCARFCHRYKHHSSRLPFRLCSNSLSSHSAFRSPYLTQLSIFSTLKLPSHTLHTASLSWQHQNVELTSKRLPHLKRGDFAKVTEEDLRYFDSILPGRVLTDEDELDACNTDWMYISKG